MLYLGTMELFIKALRRTHATDNELMYRYPRLGTTFSPRGLKINIIIYNRKFITMHMHCVSVDEILKIVRYTSWRHSPALSCSRSFYWELRRIILGSNH